MKNWWFPLSAVLVGILISACFLLFILQKRAQADDLLQPLPGTVELKGRKFVDVDGNGRLVTPTEPYGALPTVYETDEIAISKDYICKSDSEGTVCKLKKPRVQHHQPHLEYNVRVSK